jgi:16S rRNA (guanine527-N7)-methyltransferase
MISRKTSNTADSIEREITELKEGLNELDIAFEQSTLDRFKVYLEVLYHYHGKIHLLSHRDYERIALRHFLPSLLILPDVMRHKRVCDIGSGAGFPSVPLKILVPHLDLVIFEAQRKKANFLKTLVQTLELKKTKIVNARAETYSGVKFDLALLRAVGKIRRLIAVLNLLIEPGSEAIFLKAVQVEKELAQARKALHQWNYQVSVRKVSTPVEKSSLSMVILRKM